MPTQPARAVALMLLALLSFPSKGQQSPEIQQQAAPPAGALNLSLPREFRRPVTDTPSEVNPQITPRVVAEPGVDERDVGFDRRLGQRGDARELPYGTGYEARQFGNRGESQEGGGMRRGRGR